MRSDEIKEDILALVKNFEATQRREMATLAFVLHHLGVILQITMSSVDRREAILVTNITKSMLSELATRLGLNTEEVDAVFNFVKLLDSRCDMFAQEAARGSE